jgi:hypothetical protein
MEKILSKITVDTTGIKLNLLTLSIGDKQVKREFEAHKIAIQNKKFFFWMYQGLVVLNTVDNCYKAFFLGELLDGLISASIGIMFFSVLWSICYFRFPEKSKYVFCGFYIVSWLAIVILKLDYLTIP